MKCRVYQAFMWHARPHTVYIYMLASSASSSDKAKSYHICLYGRAELSNQLTWTHQIWHATSCITILNQKLCVQINLFNSINNAAGCFNIPINSFNYSTQFNALFFSDFKVLPRANSSWFPILVLEKQSYKILNRHFHLSNVMLWP